MTRRTWRKSSYCQEGEACVHISTTADAVHLTDNDPPRAILTVSPVAFTALIDLLKSSAGR
jgi:hypothetical protein